MMRNHGHLLFNLEYPGNDWVLAVHGSFILGMSYTLQFWRHSLSKAVLNRPKLQSVKRLYVFFGKGCEFLRPCDLNAGLILDEYSFFREIFEVCVLV